MDVIGKAEEVEERLPASLQELLPRLEGEMESSGAVRPLERIAVKVEREQTRISFSVRADGPYDSLQEGGMVLTLGAQGKLKLLQAVGSCKTLRKIDVEDLTANELEVLLTRMFSNPVLESLGIWSRTGAEPRHGLDEYVGTTCEILGTILRTSRTLKSLFLMLYRWGLTPAGAYHLALGLRGNAESVLEVLYLHHGRKSNVIKQVSEIVLSAPRLRELGLLEVGVLDNYGTDALAKALAQSTSLQSLWLRNVVSGASALLLKAFTGEGSNQTINTLQLEGFLNGIGDSLPILLSSNRSLKELFWEPLEGFEYLRPSEWRSLGQWLSSSSSFVIFRVGLSWSSFRAQAIDGVETLLSAVGRSKPFVGLYVNSFLTHGRFAEDSTWFSSSEWMDEDAEELLCEGNVKKPICELHFGLHTVPDLTAMWADLAKALCSNVTLISSLHMQMSPRLLRVEGRHAQVASFFEALRDSSSLRLLTIEGGSGDNWPGGWKSLVDCLHFNTSITHLRVLGCTDLNDDVFKDFTRVLRVNSTLKKIRFKGTSWETDGKKRLIEEDLRRNAALALDCFSVFTRQGLPFHSATTGRLFLCGSSNSGKTRLRWTMTQREKTTTLRRTVGIEVELLKGDQEMQIAIWDLAGHRIFRPLEDIFFPQTNFTSIFLFVFSPYDRENRCIREDLERHFKQELNEWLRFIASNSRMVGKILPKVLVVISHMDKMRNRNVDWAKSIVQERREEFQNILDICSGENLYQVDARRTREVTPLRDFVFEIFEDLLKDKSHIVPKVCSQMSYILANRAKDMKLRPLWLSKSFFSFCFDSLQDSNVIKSLSPETTSGVEVFKAIASYLHDAGYIIVIPSLDWIIVDPNWLTNVFLGELITIGHNFQVNRSSGQTPEPVALSSRTGFVSSGDLQLFLSSFLGKHLEFRGLDIWFLEELLINFDFCCKLDSGQVNARYYIPTIVCEDASFSGNHIRRRAGREIQSLSWSSLPGRNQEFIGFRVQCENPRIMSMTAALYPRFQIYLHHKLRTEMNITAGNAICSRNYMHLRMDDHEIFIERSEMADSHIDVMVKCSEYKSRDSTVRYIEQHIIDELVAFCGSPKGCPGIALVVGILPTQWVQNRVPMAHRRGSFEN